MVVEPERHAPCGDCARSTRSIAVRALRFARRIARLPSFAPIPLAIVRAALVAAFVGLALGGFTVDAARAQVDLPNLTLDDPVVIAADSGNRWTQGAYEVLILHGNVYINQGLVYARAKDAVLWLERGGFAGDPPHKVIAYLEGDVTIDYQKQVDIAQGGANKRQATVKDQSWFGRFQSRIALTIQIKNTTGAPDSMPPLFQRAMKARDPSTPDTPGGYWPGNGPPGVAAAGSAAPGAGVRPAQFVAPAGPAAPKEPEEVPLPSVGTRRLRVFPRTDARVQAQWFPNPAASEQVAVLTSGINLIVDGMPGFGSIDVAADRIVLWTKGTQPDLTGQVAQTEDTPLEMYLEGNIVFRQGERVIFADRMYYDVTRKKGTVLQAEVLTPISSYSGLIRLRADVLRQVDENQFVADDASLTSSRMGVPSYDFRTSRMTFIDAQLPVINAYTGAAEVDPVTGQPLVEHERLATGSNNVLFLGPLPVFYWPRFATDLEQPSFLLQRILVKEDTIYGDQLLVNFNAYQLFGIKNRPTGTRWTLSTDYFSLRGPALGTNFRFDRPDFFGLAPGRNYGMFDAWGIVDHRGFDTLGADRRTDTFNNEDRGRVYFRDRQMLPDNWQLTLEAGYISDRNFLEQWFENEWDQFKDENTGAELKRFVDNSSFSATADVRVNDFFTDTNWLPRGDHFMLGQSLLGDRLTWYEHTSLGYAQQKVTVPPTSAEDLAAFQLMPWEVPVAGDREVTRQEIDIPFQLGAVKFVPYGLGELGHWGQVLNGEDLNRAYGQFGARASVPMTSITSDFESDLWNVHGLAHKVVFTVDAGYTAATTSVLNFPLYDNPDDNNIEAFRRRFVVQEFNGSLPPQLDERLYAIRYGMSGDVTSPTAELAGNMFAVRFDVRQRWQTKRGPANNRHVIDWITLDANTTFYPNPQADNFGAVAGLTNYDLNWFVGDRVTVMSNGYFEFYNLGPQYLSLGAFLNRPPRGAFYAGIHSLNGPIHSTVLISSYNYRMSPKWFSTFGSTFVLGGQGNIGENFQLTRIGEAFLTGFGFNVDASKGNVGFMISIEPRFLPHGRLNALTGGSIAPAGTFGLE